jgi:hypothetical protein
VLLSHEAGSEVFLAPALKDDAKAHRTFCFAAGSTRSHLRPTAKRIVRWSLLTSRSRAVGPTQAGRDSFAGARGSRPSAESCAFCAARDGRGDGPHQPG